MKRCFILLVAALIASVLISSSGAQAANLIKNGSFEVPALFDENWYELTGNSIESWQVNSGNVDLIQSLWQSNNSRQSIDLNGNVPGSISQSFDTKVGRSYKVTFDMSGNFDPEWFDYALAAKHITVNAGDKSISFEFNKFPGWDPSANMGWTQKSFFFTATDTISILSFASNDDGRSGAVIDNISVTPNPEPSSLLLGLLGLSGLMKLRMSFAKA